MYLTTTEFTAYINRVTRLRPAADEPPGPMNYQPYPDTTVWPPTCINCPLEEECSCCLPTNGGHCPDDHKHSEDEPE